jgi:hypothetical protein
MRRLGGTGVVNTWAMPGKVAISERRTGESLKISATPAVRFLVASARSDGRAGAPARRRDAGPSTCPPERPDLRPERPAHVAEPHAATRSHISLLRDREAIADGYNTCAVTSVPAADVEGAVLDQIQTLLAAPELVARTWATAKREGKDEITEREVTILLTDFGTVWSELFPAEQARVVQLLVEQVDVQEDALEVRFRAEGLASLVGELRQQGERKAA